MYNVIYMNKKMKEKFKSDTAYALYCYHNDEETSKRIKDLIPSDKEEFKKIFRIDDSKIDEYTKDITKILTDCDGIIMWDKDTKTIILKGVGHIEGVNILTVLRDFIYKEDLWQYDDENEVISQIINRYIGIHRIQKAIIYHKYVTTQNMLERLEKEYSYFSEKATEAAKLSALQCAYGE